MADAPTTHTPTPMRITGTIERVTFHSADSGFAVLRVRVKGAADPVPIVGRLASPREGESVEAEGRWIVDPKHGRQFQAEHLESRPPVTRDGMLKYLSSGFIKGVGPHLAGLLIDCFGDELFDVIENAPNKLLRVKGLGRKRLAQIRDSWQTQKAFQDALLFLQQHGIGSERAWRIYQLYGPDTVKQIKADPYRLSVDLHGVGFATADAVANSLGVEPTSPMRARAGVRHVLSALTTDGHCAYPEPQLVEKACALLGVDDDIVRAAIDDLIGHAVLVRDAVGGDDDAWLYLRGLHQAEIGLAEDLVSLLSIPPALADLNVEAALDWVRDKTALDLSATQRMAVAAAFRHKVLVITGGPGVGKTTILKSLLLIARAKEQTCLLAAPTGRAAKRMAEATGMEAKTIHRLLEFDPRTNEFARSAGNPLEADFVIVDEASMMDLPLSRAIVEAVPEAATLVLVGDVDQLPSVGPGNVLRDLIHCGQIPTMRLTEIYRQSEHGRIVSFAHQINHGEIPDLTTPEDIADFYFIPADEPIAIQERIVELVSRRIPRRFDLNPMADVQVLTPMNRGPLGTEALNGVLQDALNPRRPERSEWSRPSGVLRVGDRVMQTENNYDKEVFNGDIGIVQRVDARAGEIDIVFDGRRVQYERGELGAIVHAYAVTIHKSQGSEYPAVVIPIHTQHYRMLQRNLIYTAITRARQLVVIVGMPKALRIAVHRAETGRRYGALAQRLRNAVD